MGKIELWTQLRPSDLEQTPVPLPCLSNGNHTEPIGGNERNTLNHMRIGLNVQLTVATLNVSGLD